MAKYHLYPPTVQFADQLIGSGAVNRDGQFDLSLGDESRLLGSPTDWPGYGAWHLGCATDAPKNAKESWAYPVGKNGKLHVTALRSASITALVCGEGDIAKAARDLLHKVAKNESRTWFEMKKVEDTGEIFIFDEIGFWGITAKNFIDDFKALGEVKHIKLHINSPGGLIFDGLAIFNLLSRAGAKKTVYIDGIAASIASVIAMAGDEIIMPENAFMFVHDPMGGAWGYAEDLRSVAGTLEKMKAGIITAYRNKTKLDDAAISALMDDETWLTAAEAKELGFADTIEKPVKIAASFNLSKFRGAPFVPLWEHAEGVGGEPAGATEPAPAATSGQEPACAGNADPAEIAAACNEAGYPALAADFLKRRLPLDKVVARLGEAKAITAACALGRHPHKAMEYINAGRTLDEVRIALFELLAASDDALRIDTSLPAASNITPIPTRPKHTESWAKAFKAIDGGRKS